MNKYERILKKIEKLLKLYGVKDEQQVKQFVADVQDAKYDEGEDDIPQEQEQVEKEQPETETEQVEEQEVEEQPENVEEGNEEEVVEDEQPQEELPEQPLEEGGDEIPEAVEEQPFEEVANEGEEQIVEEQQPMDQPETTYDAKAQIDELQKTNAGLVARLEALEDIVSKLGVDKEEENQSLGASPAGNPVNENYNSAFDEINKKRVG